MWEYNIFLGDELQYDDYDYEQDEYSNSVEYKNEDTIQNFILLAATRPRRNRNVFGLPPREVVIY